MADQTVTEAHHDVLNMIKRLLPDAITYNDKLIIVAWIVSEFKQGSTFRTAIASHTMAYFDLAGHPALLDAIETLDDEQWVTQIINLTNRAGHSSFYAALFARSYVVYRRRNNHDRRLAHIATKSLIDSVVPSNNDDISPFWEVLCALYGVVPLDFRMALENTVRSYGGTVESLHSLIGDPTKEALQQHPQLQRALGYWEAAALTLLQELIMLGPKTMRLRIGIERRTGLEVTHTSQYLYVREDGSIELGPIVENVSYDSTREVIVVEPHYL